MVGGVGEGGFGELDVEGGSYTDLALDEKFAAVQFLFMANLREIDEKTGPRGYRYALMNAGRLGQRLYLGAAALNIGCCGIGALYDAEARDLLFLSSGSALLYLVAVGPLTTKNFG